MKAPVAGFERCREYLKKLIAFASVNPPGNELEAAQWVADELAANGIPCVLQPVEEGRANVISVPQADCTAVLLTGHLDVVPVSEGWLTDPFVCTEKDGKLWGRGACDMKGGVAAMMAAAVTAREHSACLPFQLAFVADEEFSGKGMKVLLPSMQPGKTLCTIVGEPTMNQLHIAHRGALRFRIRILGRSCHGSSPHLGVNAIEHAAIVMQAIQKLNEAYSGMQQGILPPPTICCTTISAGIKDNVVPDLCEICVDCRPVVGQTAESVEKDIRRQIDELGGLSEGVGLEMEPYINSPACRLEMDSAIVQWACGVYENTFHEPPVIAPFPACCDMRKFNAAGFPALLYGPGSIEQAHTDNEFVTLSQLEQAYDFYYHCLISKMDIGKDA